MAVMNTKPPESVRKIVEAMASRAMSRCLQEGIPIERFYRAMVAVQVDNPKVSVLKLFELVFDKLHE